ncbi:HNH endonuclease [Persephonella sp.]
MLKLDFSKYTEEFKEEFFDYIINKRELRQNLIDLREENRGNNSLVNLIDTLLEESTLSELIIGDYNSLIRLRWTLRKFKSILYEFREDFERIFVKEGYDKLKNTIKPKKIVSLLSIKTCPYCNINFIYGDRKRNYGVELDHIMPKNRYPIFAVSLANLIPSCGTCNKSKSDRKIQGFKSLFKINSFEDFKFTFIPDIELKTLTEIKLEEIEKNIKSIDFIKEVKANSELFSLKERYQKHKDIVAEIIQKQRLINYHKEKMDSNVLGISFPSSEEEYRLIYCNYYPISEEEFLKRPLSKLTFDIYKELNNPY